MDLVAHRIQAVPVRIGRERERVEVRGDVALAAGIAVHEPGAADVLAALDHDEVVEPPLLQPDGHAEAAEAGADDRDLVDMAPLHARPASPAASCARGPRRK